MSSLLWARQDHRSMATAVFFLQGNCIQAYKAW